MSAAMVVFNNPIIWMILLLASVYFMVMLHFLTLSAHQITVIQQLNSWIAILPTLLAAIPLLGLLGTVMGLLSTFAQLSTGSMDVTHLLSGGIADALFTTQVGLATVVPGLIMLGLLKKRARYWGQNAQ